MDTYDVISRFLAAVYANSQFVCRIRKLHVGFLMLKTIFYSLAALVRS